MFLENLYEEAHDELQKCLNLKQKTLDKLLTVWDTHGLLCNWNTLDLLYAGSPDPPHFTGRVISRILTSAGFLTG